MYPADLDTLVDRELRELPSPRAPQTLLPRVLTAVEQWAGRPWYARAWVTWPMEWQIVSLAALALLVLGGALLTTSARGAVSAAMSSRLSSGIIGELAQVALRADAMMNAGRVVWRALLEPLAVYAFALVALMCAVCVAFGTALDRLAFGRP